MLKSARGKTLVLSLLCICLLLFVSCAAEDDIILPVLEDYDNKILPEERTSLKLGVVTGPYGDMFMEIVEPLLAQKGYSIELVTYNNYVEPNFALAHDQIDFNAFQHRNYLNSFKIESDLDLSAIAEIPTAAMGVYSQKYLFLNEVEIGAAIAIPNDSTNLSRALSVLSSAGLISVDPAVDSAKLTLAHITQNPKNLQFIPLEAQLLCDALADYDLAVINGNFAISGGLSLSDSLFRETLTNHEYVNVVAIRTDDMGRQFVMDLTAVLRSEEYKQAIMEEGGKYSHFQYPCNFSTNMN